MYRDMSVNKVLEEIKQKKYIFTWDLKDLKLAFLSSTEIKILFIKTIQNQSEKVTVTTHASLATDLKKTDTRLIL